MIEIPRSQSEANSEPPRIKLAGVGGAGGNVIDRLLLDGASEFETIAIDTDVNVLTGSMSPQKLQLGRAMTRGLGTGGDPEVGYAAAEESCDEIRHALEGSSMIFICAGPGGGTGSGAAPLVASIAREMGALVVAIVVMPFAFQGKRRRGQADETLEALRGVADAVVCFENDKMGDVVAPTASAQAAFDTSNRIIAQCVCAMARLLQRPGLIHIGFDDLVAALRGSSGTCLFGYGEAEGNNRAHDALARALKNPLMDRGKMLAESDTLLVNVAGGASMTLSEVQILMEELNRHINDQTRLLFGLCLDAQLGSRMSVSLISSTQSEATPPAPVKKSAPPRSYQIIPPAPAKNSGPAPVPDAAEAIPSNPVSEPTLLPEIVVETEALLERSDPELVPVETTPVVPLARPAKNGGAPKPEKNGGGGTANAGAPAKVREEKQETLQFEPVSRGRFEKSEPTIVDGEDLDVPTFLRRNMKLK